MPTDAPDALWDGTVGAHNTPRKLPGVYPAADERVRVGSMHLVRETALRAAMQASAFNSALASERLDERSAFYDHHTQVAGRAGGCVCQCSKRISCGAASHVCCVACVLCESVSVLFVWAST